MVQSDPYKTLGLSHTATLIEIKRAYHSMARIYHPDKYVMCTNEQEKQQAASKFADCAAAYSLLSDPKRKAEYDHIYKYGGYDDNNNSHIENCNNNNNNSRTSSSSSQKQHDSTSRQTTNNNNNNTTGIGYTCYDPFAFITTQGRIRSQKRVAGIHVPSRIQNLTGISFAYSSAKVVKSPSGSMKCFNETTQFTRGKKITKKETITYYPDGRKDVIIIEGDDHDGTPKRYTTTTTTTSSSSTSTYHNVHHQQELPWYIHAWQNIREKLTLCINPCAVVAAE